MITIICDSNIEYTKGDTFSLNITTSGGFDENSQLDFIVAENENSVPIIENTYNLNSESGFTVTLTSTDTNKFNYTDYIYKMTLHTPEGEIITQKSGNFKVKWGAWYGRDEHRCIKKADNKHKQS